MYKPEIVYDYDDCRLVEKQDKYRVGDVRSFCYQFNREREARKLEAEGYKLERFRIRHHYFKILSVPFK